MPFLPPPPPAAVAASPCRASQLRLSADAGDGDFNGMSHSGTELSVRNLGPDCTLPALPLVTFRDARGRTLRAVRKPPVGMHPGPVMVPVRIAGGHRAATGIRWVSGPVYDRNRKIVATSIAVRIGRGTIATDTPATLYAPAGSAATFDQPPLRAMEGMAAG